MRALLALGIAVALVVLASACGGGGKKAASETTTTTAASSKSASSTEAGKSSTPSFASTHDCGQLAALGAQVAKSLQTTSGDFQATVANEDKVLQAIAKAVPSEIRGDFQTFASAFHTYLQA